MISELEKQECKFIKCICHSEMLWGGFFYLPLAPTLELVPILEHRADMGGLVARKWWERELSSDKLTKFGRGIAQAVSR
jgi:hypothetical protein